MDDFFLIAKIISSYGKEGFVRVEALTEFPERFFKLEKVYIEFFGDNKIFFIDEIKKVKNFFIFKFKNFNSDKDVQVLTGKEIFIESSEAVKLPENYFFIHDLIGSEVYQNNIRLGKIEDVLSLPGNDVYVVVKENKEILVPAVLSYVENFNPEKKIMTLKKDADLRL